MDGAQSRHHLLNNPTTGNAILQGLGNPLATPTPAPGGPNPGRTPAGPRVSIGPAFDAALPALMGSAIRGAFYVGLIGQALGAMAKTPARTLKKVGNKAQGTSQPGRSLILRIKGATLRIPPNALPPGTEVQLTRRRPTPKGFKAPGGEKPITPIYTLKFPVARRLKRPLQFQLEVPGKEQRGIYSYVKITGGRPFGEFRGSTNWQIQILRSHPRIGRYLNFYSTAQEISVVGVKKK